MKGQSPFVSNNTKATVPSAIPCWDHVLTRLGVRTTVQLLAVYSVLLKEAPYFKSLLFLKFLQRFLLIGLTLYVVTTYINRILSYGISMCYNL